MTHTAISPTAAVGHSLPAAVHPVDDRLSVRALLVFGLQHVLVMYAGAIAVPLIIGGALALPKDELALLINSAMLASGIVTLIQSVGFWKLGIRLPVMMGVSFVAVAPMLAMAADPELGLPGIFGAVIAAGLFGVTAAPFISRMLPLFPPVVTGTIITAMGLSLMRVTIEWAGGGAGHPDFGAPTFLGVAMTVLASIVAITRWARGFWADIAVLLGLVIGFLFALALGHVEFDGVAHAPWIAVVSPLHFGLPTFDPIAIATMCIVMIVVMVQSMGMFLALGEMTGRVLDRNDLARGLRVNGVGSIIGGVFNTFVHSPFSQNVGLVGITGARSRWVCVAGGAILVALGLLPKVAMLVASIPLFVLGGAGIVMFGMVAATGIRILSGVKFDGHRRHNLYIVAISVGFGLIPEMSAEFFSQMPQLLGPILHSGILLAALLAIVLNGIYNGWTPQSTA